MSLLPRWTATLSLVLLMTSVRAASIEVRTLTGSAEGFRDGSFPDAQFAYPVGITTDPGGTVYVADSVNHVIRRISPQGVVSTFAGLAGFPGSRDGVGASARFQFPNGISSDREGNLYVADTGNHTIRKIDRNLVVTTVGGTAGSGGYNDGSRSRGLFASPTGVAVGSDGIYVADFSNHAIRKILSDGSVMTLAGNGGLEGSANGRGTDARFYYPFNLVFDSKGNLFVTDSENHTIRKIAPDRVVTTPFGAAGVSGSADGGASEARFHRPTGIGVDAHDRLYITDTNNHSIRFVDLLSRVTTLAGAAGFPGRADGKGTNGRFDRPFGIVVDPFGDIVIADTYNHSIRFARRVPLPRRRAARR